MRISAKSIFDTPLPAPELVPGIVLGRFWSLGTEPVWSRHRMASLLVSADAFPTPRPICLRVQLHAARPDAPQKLRLQSPGHPDQTCTITTSDPVELLLRTPHHADGARHTPIQLELDQLARPATMGIGAELHDDRQLGLRICDLTVDVPDLRSPILPGDPGVAGAILETGWDQPEEGRGVWSLGSVASLRLPGYLNRGDAPQQLRLVFDSLPRPEGTAPLEIALVAGEHRLEHVTSQQDYADQALSLALPSWTSFRPLHVTLRFSHLASPAQLNINADPRPLGIFLKALDLEAAGTAQA